MGPSRDSTTPKKDSMGMDYLPYEGEQDDDSSVKVSAGKIAKGRRSDRGCGAARLSTVGREPGTVQEDDAAKRSYRCVSKASSTASKTSPPARKSMKGQRLSESMARACERAAEYLRTQCQHERRHQTARRD